MFVCVGFASTTAAITFELTDGTKIEGDIILSKPDALQIRVEGNKYEKFEWSKFSQATLQELRKDHKLAPYVEPYIEVTIDEKIKKTEVNIKEVPRLERPAKKSLIGAMFSSSVGIVCLLLLYAANIYAGHEVATVRAQPPALVCGIAAIAPVIGPVIFLCLPTKMPKSADELAEEEHQAAATQSASYGAEAAAHTGSPQDATQSESTTHNSASFALPQTQSFKRGQFTFNRRFIETKFAGFFSIVRKDAEKDLLLIVKSVRGEHVVQRISEIAANDMHAEVYSGAASHSVNIPFVEIQEMQIKHKDA